MDVLIHCTRCKRARKYMHIVDIYTLCQTCLIMIVGSYFSNQRLEKGKTIMKKLGLEEKE